MECPVCSIRSSKFWCAACVRKHIAQKSSHSADLAASQAQLIQRIQTLLADHDDLKLDVPARQHPSLSARVADLEQLVQDKRSLINADRQRLQALRETAAVRMKAITDAQGQLQSARVQQAQQMEASLKRSNDSLSQTLHTLLGFRRLLVKDLVAVYRIRKIQKRYNNNSSSAGNTGSNGNSSNGISNASDQRPPISAVSMTRHSTAGPTGGTDTQADAPRQQTHSQTEQHPQGQSSLGSLSLLVMQGLASLSQVAQQHVTGIAAPQPIRAVAASGARHEERLAKPLTRPATDTTRAAPGMEHHIEYRVVHVGFTIYGNLASLSSSQREKLNAVVGYATQMTLLLSHYLGVMLPYEIFMLDAQPMIRQVHSLSSTDDGLRSLVSTDRNTEAFVTALALLAYNVAYLCFSQDVIIPVEQTVYLLENIAACCQAPGLGRDMTDTRQSTAADSKVFGIELARVVQMHAACWTTGKPWELVSMPLPTHSADGLGTHVGNESAEDGDGAWDLVDGSDRPI